MRPKGVLLQYKELLRVANRDEQTLIGLENQLRVLELQESKLEDPWELISEPTLSIDPVGISRTRLGFIGLIAGLFFGVVVALIKEKKSDLIFEEDILRDLLNTEIIEKINLIDSTLTYNDKNIFKNEILQLKSNKTLRVIKSTSLIDSQYNSFLELIFNKKEKSLIKESLEDLSDKDNIIFICNMNGVSYFEVFKIKKMLKIINKEIFGTILLEES